MWTCIRSASATAAAITLAVLSIAAQSKPDLQFDVVSVKPNVSTTPQSLRVTPGRVSVTNVPLRTLIQFAYQVQARQLADAPDWISKEKFDILATASANTSVEDMRGMLRSMLADRFHLTVHKEMREVPTYALRLARRDGKLGPNLHESAVDCVANGSRPVAAAAQDQAQQDPSKRCMILPLFGQGKFQARGLHMENLASALNNIVDRTIVDKTGLAGAFELELSWTPDAVQMMPATPGEQTDIAGPSLFTALQEQLGLKLSPERDQAEVLVIDRVDRPTPD